MGANFLQKLVLDEKLKKLEKNPELAIPPKPKSAEKVKLEEIQREIRILN